MSFVAVHLHGNLGNQVMCYLHARAYAERYGCELQISNRAYKAPEGKIWLGEMIFELSEQIAERSDIDYRGEPDCISPFIPLREGDVDICLNGYWQYQDAMIYTAAQAKRWLRLRPQYREVLDAMNYCRNVFHLRRGNWMAHGMVVVSEDSYARGAVQYGFDATSFDTIEEASAETRPQPFAPELSFLADFYRLMTAPVLFRSNSTFAWVAALLNGNRVFSPEVTGKEKYKEVLCDFKPGNSCAIWAGDGIDRTLTLPEERFVSHSQAAQDRFVHELIVKPDGLLNGTFLDIGAHHPHSLSNTCGLEQLGWRGWLVERAPDYCQLLRAHRTSHVIEADATVVDWKALNLPDEIDYLSIDVDEDSLTVLRNLPMERVRFLIITIEHNAYFEGDRMRVPQRELLSRLGYVCACSDVRFDRNAFEDWWVCPALMPRVIEKGFCCRDREASDILK